MGELDADGGVGARVRRATRSMASGMASGEATLHFFFLGTRLQLAHFSLCTEQPGTYDLT